jgi:hypothetical protein
MTPLPTASDTPAPFAELALAFAQALVAEDYDAAQAMLADDLRATLDARTLGARYEDLIGEGDGPPIDVSVVSTLTQWPEREAGDLGWACVGIAGDDYVEGIAVVVARQGATAKIRAIEWGRP